MIGYISYKFWVDEYGPFIFLDIEGMWKDPYLLNTELSQLDSEYIRQIVEQLEKVQSWEQDMVEFGFETTLITVVKKWYKAPNGNFYPDGNVYISYSYGESWVETNLKIDDILEMMTDYRDYVDAWEKETGKIKK